MRELLLLGASGLAREVADAVQHAYRVIGVLDDDAHLHGSRVAGVDVLGGTRLAAELDADLLVCVGSGSARRSVVRRLLALGVGEQRFGTLVDASVHIPGSCSVGVGSILLAGTVLTTDVTVGKHAVVMPNVTLTHDNVLKDFATVASGVCLGGGVVLGEASYLGMNASVRQSVRVGAGAVIGMGSVVLHDVPNDETWAGVPADALAVARPGGSP
ncbi:acetyltransferase [Parafrigoribacterium mesophilum]|uniref:NeuD/PglB/VioB family sugar acetyltransferase n=1 Tax=Parafrigoribacterium mesophilum TaxID=433646 RepID=UPI0031FC4D02